MLKLYSQETLISKERYISVSPTGPGLLNLNGSRRQDHIRHVRKVRIQARLDLHGDTLNQAHVRLARFLRFCQGQGYLWVLVITGKGRRHRENEELYETSSRRTLRDLAPQWLEDPALQAVVSAYTSAKPQDGGAGALYVRLKRLR